jgi:DMSO/TMAO reductase YedYZ molybdopterin-dependent catalytic subunit
VVLRFVNTSIQALIILLTLSGFYGLVWAFPGWMYEIHRISGWALIGLIPWKIGISLRSLGRGLRPSFDRGIIPIVSVALSAVVCLIIALGLMWAWRVGPELLWLNYSVISWHWILALAIVPPFALHAWQRWPRPKRNEFLSRQGFIKLAGLSFIGVAGWGASKVLASYRATPDEPRAASGSRLKGYLSGNSFPVTNSVGDGQKPIDLSAWRLLVGGDVVTPLTLTYQDLLDLPSHSLVATLDCTVGWYSVQRWKGIRLQTLIDQARPQGKVLNVHFRAVEGHGQGLLFVEAKDVILCTHVGGAPLGHIHGFPLRAVVPSRRGWFWVKWLSEIVIISAAAHSDRQAHRTT